MTAPLSNGVLCKLLDGKQLLIFDFDGTLADTCSLHEAAFNAVLTPWKMCINYSTIAGLCTRDALAVCFAEAGVHVLKSQLEELTLSKQTLARALIQKNLQPLPGVDEFLRWAKLHYRLALYSSGSRKTVILALKKLGYVDWFELILCAEDVNRSKPDPEGFLKVLQLTGVSANNAIVFEDAESGLIAAHQANLTCVKVDKNTFI